jgi:hypothetical protein
MIETINEKVSVISIYDAQKHTSLPYLVKWQGKKYRIVKIGYHHRQRQGRIMKHIYSVSSTTLFFRLNFDSENLSWTLEQVSDGLAD